MKISRRALSASLLAPFAFATPGASAQQRPDTPARRRATKVFKEIAASLYAWDLVDQGCEPIMETLKETAQANSLYLVALMHHEKRPLTDFYFPHNSTRKTYFPEDSRVYWFPHADSYRDSKIKPIATNRDEFKKTDWLDLLVKAARKGGWKTGAEISHTVLDKQRAAGEFISVIQRDIHGRPAGQLICPNNPVAMTYLLALFTDLVKNYDLDFVQTCLRPFIAGESRGSGTATPMERVLQTVTGTCFCDSCVAAAKSDGFDLKAAQKAMLPLADALSRPGDDLATDHFLQLLRASNTSAEAVLLRHPEIFDFLKFRCASMTKMFARVHDTVRSINPKIDVRLNAFIYDFWELSGIEFSALGPHLGSIRSSNYDEQEGRMEYMEHKRQFLLAVRAAAGDDIPFLSSIGIRPKATPELVRKGVLISSECGADGLSLGHYDGASLRLLEAIGDGLRDADVRVG
jgi:hypothetical protein